MADLQVPPSVTILSEPESVIVRIEAPRMVEEEEVAVEEVEVAVEPEVIGRREAEEEDKEPTAEAD